jgi:hypothetical protein
MGHVAYGAQELRHLGLQHLVQGLLYQRLEKILVLRNQRF